MTLCLNILGVYIMLKNIITELEHVRTSFEIHRSNRMPKYMTSKKLYGSQKTSNILGIFYPQKAIFLFYIL